MFVNDIAETPTKPFHTSLHSSYFTLVTDLEGDFVKTLTPIPKYILTGSFMVAVSGVAFLETFLYIPYYAGWFSTNEGGV